MTIKKHIKLGKTMKNISDFSRKTIFYWSKSARNRKKIHTKLEIVTLGRADVNEVFTCHGVSLSYYLKGLLNTCKYINCRRLATKKVFPSSSLKSNYPHIIEIRSGMLNFVGSFLQILSNRLNNIPICIYNKLILLSLDRILYSSSRGAMGGDVKKLEVRI